MPETPYQKKERLASEKLEALLLKPMPVYADDIGDLKFFDPWELFPFLYGSYSGDFDKCALQVLQEIHDKEFFRDDVGAYMFREMLCTSGFCDYGSSPRSCFSTQRFGELLPKLINKWREWSLLHWGKDICA